jgi:predicted MFS family arabinose efflux permease
LAGKEQAASSGGADQGAGAVGPAANQMAEGGGWNKTYRTYFMSLLALTAFLNILDRLVFSILLEPIKHELLLSDTALGIISGGAFAIVYTIAGFPLGYLSDRGDRRYVLGGTLIVWSAMTAVSGFARNYWQLLFARMGVGVGEAGSLPASMSAIADMYPPERRSGAIGLIYGFGTMGAAAAMAAGGYLETVVGWRSTLMIVSVPGMVLGLVFLLATRDTQRRRPTTQPLNIKRSIGEVLRIPTFQCMTVMSTLFVFIASAIVNWTPTFLIRVHHMSASHVGWALGMTGLAGGLGSMLSGRLADRLSGGDVRRLIAVMVLGPVIALPIFWFFLFSSSSTAAIASFFAVQFLLPAYLGPSYALVISVAPRQSRALSIAIVAFFQNLLGYTLGPVAVGWLNDLFLPGYGQDGIRISLAIVSLAILGIAAMSFLTGRLAARDIRAAEGS